MKISVGTLFPALYEPFVHTSLIQRAQKAGHLSIHVHNMFQGVDPLERVDGPTYGHGPGMLIRPEVVEKTIEELEAQHGRAYKIFFSPHGTRMTQTVVRELVQRMRERACDHVMLLPARYEGMDARVEETYADAVYSIGDMVLMGGDLPAMVFMEAFARYIPGVVGKTESVEQDSFTGPFVDHPHYTMPAVWQGKEVPEVLRSGNHKAIAQWQRTESVRRSVIHHFGWVRSFPHISAQDTKDIQKVMPPHYVALMHTEVLLPAPPAAVAQGGASLVPGTTSVTSLDIHDIARSCATYGVVGYGVITPLKDQQEIVKTLLDFWHTGAGVTYNPHRHQAVQAVRVQNSLQEWIETIAEREGKRPLVVTTCARPYAEHPRRIDFHAQERVWQEGRPVLLVLGTGRGLTPELIESADFHLVPLEGFTHFNHLSVRSAAAIILDKWMGRDVRTA